MEDKSKTTSFSPIAARMSTVDESPEQSSLPDHLVRLPDSEWALWRWVGLRGAGFPVDGVLKLSASEAASQADELAHAEDEAERAWETALQLLKSDMLESSGDRYNQLSDALKQLKKGKVLGKLDIQTSATDAINEFAAACDRVDGAWSRFSEAFEESSNQLIISIYEIVQDDRFREAVIWQNRKAFLTGIKQLMDKPDEKTFRNSKRRQHEELVANYWQRYCTKNDSIGFFGPVAWAKFDEGAEAVSVRPGPQLLKTRNVYFEVWGMDALVEVLAKQQEFKPWIPPSCAPFVFLEGSLLHLPFRSPVEVSEDRRLALELCDGKHTAVEIADLLSQKGFDKIKSAADGMQVLEDLQSNNWIVRVPSVPFGAHPEHDVRRIIAGIRDPALYKQAMGKIEELEAARDHVASAAGDPDTLYKALSELELIYTRLTGAASTRNEGQMYAARTLIYEDCSRDIEVEIGQEILDSLSRPMSLMLKGARWLTAQAAQLCRDAFQEIYTDLVQQRGTPVISAMEFWSRAGNFLHNPSPSIAQRLQVTFQKKWADILSLQPDQRRVDYTSEELRAGVQAAFETTNSAWAHAGYHSPDIMLAAPSLEAIQRGDYLLIMGELHVAAHTLSWSFFLEHHPSPGEFFEGIANDLPKPRLIPQVPKYWRGVSSRCHNMMATPKDYSLVIGIDSPPMHNTKALPISALVVEETSEGLVIRTRDGQVSFDIIEAFGDPIMVQVVDTFKILAPMQHSPRITIDQLVVCRESWAFSPLELEFAFEQDESYRFIAARRWARENGLPRFIYFKSPVEIKPCFVDLDSPIYVNIFAKIIRRTLDSSQSRGIDPSQQLINVTEMLPTPDQCWLTDAQGNRYTSEFRIVALDRSA
jgi:hypothetical protein